MSEETKLRWFAVRCVYLMEKKQSNGRNVFEERIVVFSGADGDEAFAKAEQESGDYAKALGLEVHPEAEAFEQDGGPLLDGYELASFLFEADEDLETFYKNRYTAYEYTPEE